MSSCENCVDNAERAYDAEQRAEAAIRCCETGHRPPYRRGRVEGQRNVERACRSAYENGLRNGARRALVAIAALGLVALWWGRRS